MPASEDKSLLGPSHPVAGLICLFGFFLHIVLSGSLLTAMGINYAGETGQIYEKIHPGTIFIFISFFVLLWGRGNPVRDGILLAREQTPAIALLALYILIFFYVILRSGAAGTAFLIDTHMTVPICAIVLAYAPLSYCRKAAYFFVGVAVLNSAIGIAEAVGKFRIFAYDPEWSVLKEGHFRATALRGHPLNNAMFTSVALFLALALRMPSLLKLALVFIFTASLVAFGSRAGLLFCVAGLMVLGIVHLKKIFGRGNLSMQRVFGLIAVSIFMPLCFIAFLAVLLNSGIGDRLMATAHWDESANSRLLAVRAFDYMSTEEILFGVSGQRILDITYQLNSTVDLGWLENPWLLMLMNCGVIVFPFWLAATAAFVWRLIKNQPLALQMSVLAYFIVASTSNSFGRRIRPI